MSRPREATSVATSAVMPSLLEIRERLGTRGLALVAVDRRGLDAGALEVLRQAVGTVLGAAEDQDLAPVQRLDEVHQQVTLVILTTL